MKAAVFVEGHTEVEFVRRLILELANDGTVSITEEEFYGGIFLIKVISPAIHVRSEILIANCRSDGKVATAIRDRYTSLVNAGYQAILGIRDLYPFGLHELQDVKDSVATIMPTGAVPAYVHIAVAEVESWFIEEETHFSRVDPSLNRQSILAGVGYDIDSAGAESITHPAELLHEIYGLAGLAYKKRANQISRTVNSLDYGNLYLNSRARSQSLDEFISSLEVALA